MPNRTATLTAATILTLSSPVTFGRPDAQGITANAPKTMVGDAPANPGPLAEGLSRALTQSAIRAAIRKVGDWQYDRVAHTPSREWQFATLYAGFLAASSALHEPRYRRLVEDAAEHYEWRLGPRQEHADDQAIGQSYLELFVTNPNPSHLAPLRTQFDNLMAQPDDPRKPVWWWCDALFMAPPVWARLAQVTGDPRYLTYMDHEWNVTSKLLWDPDEKLFSRDATYLNLREANGRKVFWSRGNGWVMGGLVRVLEVLPESDPRRPFYVTKLREMAETVANIQNQDGLWRSGLLDPHSYSNPEISGSAFFVYALAWGLHHRILDARYEATVKRGWEGILRHIYADGRLGCIQPDADAPETFAPSGSYVFGVGAFLLAGAELNEWVGQQRPSDEKSQQQD